MSNSNDRLWIAQLRGEPSTTCVPNPSMIGSSAARVLEDHNWVFCRRMVPVFEVLGLQNACCLNPVIGERRSKTTGALEAKLSSDERSSWE